MTTLSLGEIFSLCSPLWFYLAVILFPFKWVQFLWSISFIWCQRSICALRSLYNYLISVATPWSPFMVSFSWRTFDIISFMNTNDNVMTQILPFALSLQQITLKQILGQWFNAQCIRGSFSKMNPPTVDVTQENMAGRDGHTSVKMPLHCLENTSYVISGVFLFFL